MKMKPWFLLAGMVLALLTPRHVQATGACTAARFHDWQDFGCNQNYAGAGGVPQAKCPSCPGMPQWWVHEPYENLWMSDKPLSYTTSSGQEMAFQFYYRQRYKMPDADEVSSGRNDPFATAREQVSNYYDLTGMTNASWGNNWMTAITFWDQSWETNWTATGLGIYSAPLTSVFSDGYQALLFQPEGGMNYFTSSSLQDPQSQMRLQPVSSYPMATNNPSSDTNGIYWGDSGMGFKIVYPDGSQDVFGLTYYATLNLSLPTTSSAGGNGTSTANALLTQRIDPQGRVTNIGYEHTAFTNCWPTASPDEPLGSYYHSYYGFRIKYIVDPDGRTNTFKYAPMLHSTPPAYPANNLWQLTEIDDPYGRKVQLGYDSYSGILTNITDAAGLSSSFQYAAPWTSYSYSYYPNPSNLPPTSVSYMQVNSGWITNLTTPYGSTSFSYYQLTDPTATEPDAFIQRAVYVSEPTGANQFYLYLHNSNGLIESNAPAPSVPGVTDFDNGTSGSTHPTLDYRNTIHWDRRQFSVLSGTVQSDLSSGSLSNAIAALTSYDFSKGRIRNWLWQSDALSISESMSSEQDPSPDAAGQILGLRTWYDYPGKPSPELLGGNPQVSCIARLLPDGTSQYTTFNYYFISGIPGFPVGSGFVSDTESSYSKPDGTVGQLTNWFNYAANSVDLASVSNSAGQWLNFGYNVSHQITSITNALNQVSTLSWDTYTFNLTGVQLPGGQSVGLSYGSSDYGRLQTISWSPSGRSFTINSYSNGLPASVTDDRSLTVSQTWDGLNRLTGEGFPDGTLVSNIYTRLDLTATKDRLGNWTSYSFDGLRHLTAVTNANNAVTSYSWCGCGSLDQIVDATLTNNTYLNYDNQGNLTNIEFPDSSSLTYQFDLDGRMTNAFDGAGRTLRLAYDNQGLPTNIAGAYGTLQSAIYDSLNRPISLTDANGVTVTNTYDSLNELLTRKWADGIGEGFGYSAAGIIAYTNRDGRATHYGLDTAGRITAVTNANLEAIQVAYDSLDNVTSLIDGLNHTNTWQYNQYGWLTNKMDGLGRNAFHFSYNPNGWVTNRWTPQNGNAGYGYDNVGNLTSITYPQSTNTYAYNAINQLTSMVDAVGTHNFSWTATGQLLSEGGVWASDTVTHTYSQGLQTALSLAQPSGSWSQSYGYDSAWRMTNIVSPAGTFGYSYNVQPESSLVSEISLPNEAYITNSFDGLARLTQTSLNNYYKWGHTLDGYSYGFDALGLATNITRNLGLTSSSVSVGYDNIQQITSWAAKETNGTPRLNEQLGYAFDAADNLLRRTNNLLVQTFNVDAAKELTNVSRSGTFTLSGATPAPVTNLTVNGQAAQTYGDFTFARTNLTLANGNNTFTNIAQNIYGVALTNTFTANLPSSVGLNFDNNGNLTNDGTKTLSYDSENQLTNVTVTGSYRSDFVYDGLNRRRIERDYSWNGNWIKTNETRFIYDGYLPIQERDSNNVPQVTYTRGLDLSGTLDEAGGIGGLLARTDTNGSTFYHADVAGNITALIDSRQNIVGRYLYNPSGKLTGMWGSMGPANVMRFSSKPYMQLADEYDFGFRRYRTDLPGFTTVDPLGGINPYSLGYNDPLFYVDPYGLYSLSEWGQIIGAGAGGWSDAANSLGQSAGGSLAAGYDAATGNFGLANGDLNYAASGQDLSQNAYDALAGFDPTGLLQTDPCDKNAEAGLWLGIVGGLFTGSTEEKAAAKFTVYVGRDAEGIIRYVGITSRDVATRAAEHGASSDARKALLDYAPHATGDLTKDAARTIEQNLINQHRLEKNGGSLYNQINSIAPKNWAQYGVKP
jgi:RHS repeat-associated protein